MKRTGHCRRCGREIGWFVPTEDGLVMDDMPPDPSLTCTKSYNEHEDRALADQIRSECFASMIERDVEQLLQERMFRT